MASQEILLRRIQSAKVDPYARDTPHDGLQGKAEGGRMKPKAQNCKVPSGRVVHMQAACYSVEGAPVGGEAATGQAAVNEECIRAATAVGKLVPLASFSCQRTSHPLRSLC